MIVSIQETHIPDEEFALAKSLWRLGLICSPSLNNAGGVLTFHSNSLFDNIVYTMGAKDGRSTWVIGEYYVSTDMFVFIYSPNSGNNAEFYTSLINKVSTSQLTTPL